MTYRPEYEGTLRLMNHDGIENKLRRWFDNFKIDEKALFADQIEWLVVHEREATGRTIKKVFECEIGNDHPGHEHKHRFVAMDHTAPPPPYMTFAAKVKYTPPPTKTPSELRREAEWERMQRLGYRPIKVPKKRRSAFDVIEYSNPFVPEAMAEEYDIEWAKEISDTPTMNDLMRAAREMEMVNRKVRDSFLIPSPYFSAPLRLEPFDYEPSPFKLGIDWSLSPSKSAMKIFDVDGEGMSPKEPTVTVTVTGRLANSEPEMQELPKIKHRRNVE